MIKLLSKLFDFFASLQLAVLIIISIAIISAVGTIYESKYDAGYAQQLVYYSPYMYFVLILLCVNLICVMIDRWPWKPHHSGFVFAHIGIILTLFGALITKIYGVDGSMTFPIEKTNRYVTVADRELLIYSSFGDGNPSLMHAEPVNFLKSDLRREPHIIEISEDRFEFNDYYHFAFRNEQFVASKRKNDGPAIRIQLNNQNANMLSWLHLPSGKAQVSQELGPAKIVLAREPQPYESGNLIEFLVGDSGELNYSIYLDRLKKKIKSGTLRAGDAVDTGWMNLKLRVLNFLPTAKKQITFEQQESPTPSSNSALKFKFDGEEYWIGLNSILKVFTDEVVYFISYGNRRIDLGFDILLKEFRVGRYQGINKAMTYESDVVLPAGEKVTISMNEPLKYQGYTFYQSSFEEDGTGQVVSSILSVNKDPGRWIKYLGSFLIVLGSIVLFYFKRKTIFKKVRRA